MYMNQDAAWSILIERKAERKDNRTAFIAALLMERSRIDCEAGSGEAHLAPHLAMAFAVELVRLSEALQSLAVADCNYGLNEGQEKRRDNLAGRLTALANALGFEVKTSGDPRGAVVRLLDPFKRDRGDSFAGEGWAVYR